MTKIRVAVFGAGGAMGATVCRAVVDDPSLELACVLDPRLAGIDLGQATGILGTGLFILGQKEAMPVDHVDVAVDFTRADAAFDNALYCANVGIHSVIGTTGLSSEQFDLIQNAFENSKSSCLIASNFAIGAVLMMKFASQAAIFFDTAEIIELHHENKLDAPSGTALSTAKRITESRGGEKFIDDKTTAELPGARGNRFGAGVNIHSVRMRGMIAHQEVIFGTTGQTLSIRHDSYDRSSFMPGVLLAIKRIHTLGGLTMGLDILLDSVTSFE